MCRYVAYLGDPLLLSAILYEPANGLIHQASEAMESRTRINADGFGIGWYNPDISIEPAVFKDLTPAWNNANLRSLSTTTTSHCILAHVRAAKGRDPLSRSNCHPFQFDRLLWMHNGDIPGRARLHRRVVTLASDDLVARIAGNTDSELAFTLFLSLLGDDRFEACSAEDLAAAMLRTIDRIAGWYHEDGDDRPLALNFCVANGRSIVASRYAVNAPELPTLHYCEGARLVCEDGMFRVQESAGRHCSILASEVLSAEQHWVRVERDSLVIVRDPATVEVRGLKLGCFEQQPS